MLSLLIVIAAILLAAFLEPQLLIKETRTLQSAQIPEAFEGLKIVYVSDLHGDSSLALSRIDRLVKKLNAEKPDLLLLGGDYADDEGRAYEALRRISKVKTTYGILGVRGNHDFGYDLDKVMRECGVTPCTNTGFWIEKDGARIRVAGLDDYQFGERDFRDAAGDAGEEDYVLLLSHNPLSISALSEAEASLVDVALCGHTHGGQITFLGLWGPLGDRLLPAFTPQWVKRAGVTTLYSNGIGTTALPFRFMAPPQYHVLTLSAQDK